MGAKPKYTNNSHWWARIWQYEEIVEAIEGLDGPFTVRDVFERVGVSPTTYGLTKLALADLELHGLVARAGKHGPAVLWRLLRDT